jgi:hypothetical protein
MIFPYVFETRIVTHDLGTYRYTVVFLDPAIAAELPLDGSPRLRIVGEVADVPMEGAWQPSRGRWYLMLGKPLLKAAGKGVGDEVEVRFRLAPPDVAMPEALERALVANPGARAVFEDQTVGKRRALAHRVGSAKGAETVARRVAEVLDALEGRDVPSLARLRLVVPERHPGG